MYGVVFLYFPWEIDFFWDKNLPLSLSSLETISMKKITSIRRFVEEGRTEKHTFTLTILEGMSENV